MTVSYTRGDELPAWEETVTLNGATPDLSTGWTFEVTLSKTGEDDISKTSGIVATSGGVVQVQWAVNELDITPGTWRALLTATRTSDSRQWTARERVYIRSR